MTSYIDLHLHSTQSDGSSSPTQVVQRAAELGLSAISLTDHDSVAGVQEAQNIGRDIGVEVIPGTELSVQEAGMDIHILGYFIDPENPELLAYLQKFQDARRDRAEKIVARLNRLGVRITMAQVLYKAGDGAIGRPHVADVLVEEGFVFSHDHAFQKYLGYGKPAYQSKFVLTLREAVEVIHAAGGLASLAHPLLYRRDDSNSRPDQTGIGRHRSDTCQTRPGGIYVAIQIWQNTMACSQRADQIATAMVAVKP